MKPKLVVMGDDQVTKVEMMRRIIALHPDYMPADMQKHGKREYGVDLSSGACSTTRTQFRKNGRLKPLKTGPKPAKEYGEPSTLDGVRALKVALRILGKQCCVEILEAL